MAEDKKLEKLKAWIADKTIEQAENIINSGPWSMIAFRPKGELWERMKTECPQLAEMEADASVLCIDDNPYTPHFIGEMAYDVYVVSFKDRTIRSVEFFTGEFSSWYRLDKSIEKF